MPGRYWPGLGLPSMQGQSCMQESVPSAKPLAGITTTPQQCWCVGLLLGCGTPWSCCSASPQRAEQSLCRALVAQFANPSGTMWEEICFLNVSHYQLMGMLANGASSETRGWPSMGWWESCAATGAWQDAGACYGQPQDSQFLQKGLLEMVTCGSVGWEQMSLQWGLCSCFLMSLPSPRGSPVAYGNVQVFLCCFEAKWSVLVFISFGLSLPGQ